MIFKETYAFIFKFKWTVSKNKKKITKFDRKKHGKSEFSTLKVIYKNLVKKNKNQNAYIYLVYIYNIKNTFFFLS